MCLLCGNAPQPTENSWIKGGRVDPTMLFTEGTDVGETIGTAQGIAMGEEAFGSIANGTDEDMYSVQVVNGQTYHINLVGDPSGGLALLDPTLTIFNNAGTQVGLNDDGGVGAYSFLSYTANFTGTLYLLADGFDSGEVGDYMLSVYEDDIVATTATPAVVLVDSTVTGSTSSVSDEDWYAVSLVSGGSYSFIQGPGDNGGFNSPDLSLYDSSGVLIDSDADNDGVITYAPALSGTYYVSVGAATATSGTYNLSVNSSGGGGSSNLAQPLSSIDWGFAAPSTINVFFAAGGQSFNDGDAYTTSGWDATEIAAATAAFQNFEDVANVTFNIVNDPLLADFMMVETSSIPPDQPLGYWGVGGGIVNYAGVQYNVDGWGVFNNTGTGWNAGGLAVGGYAYITLIHEIGHGMGLAHPHDNGGGSTIMDGVTSPFDSYGTFGLNQGIWTTMSYNDGWETGPIGASPSNNYGWQGSLMTLDIAVLQDTYGANNAFNTGNNTYTLPSTNAAGTYYRAIWDAGGTDTIQHTGTAAAIIDLRAAPLTNTADGGGFVSYVTGIHGGFTIANGVVIENAIGGSGADTITGNSANNTLTGNAGADTLDGGDGDDTLIGGANADTLIGGNGTDTASYASDTAVMNINIASSFAQGGSSTGDTFSSIENVIGGSGNDTITGTSFANVLDGGAGNDTLNGGNGNDTLNGGDNNDTLVGGGGADAHNGGNGSDTASYVDQTANLNINLLASTAAGGSATGDTFNSIENVTGGSGNDTITGDNANNVLTGGAGVDTLNGGGGNDTLVGGDGNDVMNGGAGADSFNGGTGGDRVTYADQSAVLVINLSNGTGSGGDATGDTYTLVEHIIGGSNNDTITGNTGNNILDGGNGNDTINGGNGLDTISGGEGNDRISGGAGADSMDGGNGSDTILYNEQTGNLVINLTTQTVSGGTTAGDTFTSIESILSGSGNDTLTGSSVNNVINGGAGNDSITGAAGNDTLTGGLGDDTFVYANGWGIDTITDFSTSDLEDIDLAALTNITDFTDLLANHVRDTLVSGVNTLEIFDGANVIRLTGYTTADIGVASAISANDFLF